MNRSDDADAYGACELLEPLVLEPIRFCEPLSREAEQNDGDSNLLEWCSASDESSLPLPVTTWDEYERDEDEDENEDEDASESECDCDNCRGGGAACEDSSESDEFNVDMKVDDEARASATDTPLRSEQDKVDCVDWMNSASGQMDEEAEGGGGARPHLVLLQNGTYRTIKPGEVDWLRRQQAEWLVYNSNNVVREFPLPRDLFRLGEAYQLNRCLGMNKDNAIYAAKVRNGGDIVASLDYVASDERVVVRAIGDVVVKLCKHRFVHDQPREASLLARLQACDHIPKLVGWHPLPETRSCAIVMQHYRSDRLSRCVFRNNLKTQTLMRQLMQALAFVHSQNVIHRDIKPSNLLWDDRANRLVLIDFDVACFYYAQNTYTQFTGTDGYIAPEIHRAYNESERRALTTTTAANGPSVRGYNEKVDIFSAGVVFAQCVFGVESHHISDKQNSQCSASGLRRRVLEATRSSPNNYRSDLDLLSAMLHKNPRQRPSATQALAHAYFQVQLS